MLRLCSIICVTAMSIAVSAQPPDERVRNRATTIDEKFVASATSGGLFELEICRMALKNSNNPDVKKIAQKMVDDHTKCHQELSQIAQNRRIAVSQQMNPVHMAIVTKLSEEQGEDFDECFLCTQVLAHEEALMCFRKEARNGQDPELKQFAQKTLPKLRDHLQMVRKACRHAQDGDHETLKPRVDKDGR